MKNKNIPITLALPENLVKDLHLYIARGQISKFVAQVVEEGLEIKKERLARDYQEASQDAEREAEAKLWETTLGDGLDETNRY